MERHSVIIGKARHRRDASGLFTPACGGRELEAQEQGSAAGSPAVAEASAGGREEAHAPREEFSPLAARGLMSMPYATILPWPA